MPPERVERKLAAILAADVAGYSRLIGLDEEGTLARLKAHRKALIDPKIAAHSGRIVRVVGDGILAEFPRAVAALRCAVEIQRAMAEHNVSEAQDRRIDFRVGLRKPKRRLRKFVQRLKRPMSQHNTNWVPDTRQVTVSR